MIIRSCTFGLALTSVSSSAWALPNGIETSSCNGCHVADVGYDGNLSLIPNRELAPGIETEFTLRIEESHMLEAGFFVYSGGVGTFRAGSGSRASESGVVHSRPVAASDGVVEVQFSWTPPAEANGLDMQVYVVAADRSSSQTGDIAASATFPMVWGCEGVTLFEDIDGDSYGNDDGARSIGCGPRQGWAVNADDCNDLWVSIHPGAKEVANNKDDDCDGEIDDGVVIGTWYRDADGDGYGAYGTDIAAETAPAGYVANSDDCNDADPEISPDGVELCDGIDNNCNQLLDDGEGVYVMCGVGICRRRWEVCDTECRPGIPMVEACNGLDDDCDGEIDEAVTCPDGSACERGSCLTAPANTGAGTITEAPRAGEPTSPSAPAASDESVAPNVGSPDATASPTGSDDEDNDSDADDGGDADDEPREPPADGAAPPLTAAGGCALARGARSPWLWLTWAVATLSRRRRQPLGR